MGLFEDDPEQRHSGEGETGALPFVQSPSVFINPNTGVFLSPSSATQHHLCCHSGYTARGCSTKNNPSLCSTPSPPRCRLSSSCPFPSVSHSGASFDPGAGFLYKKDGKSPSGSSLGLGEGRWVHSEAHKHLMLLFCHAEATSGSLTLKLLHSEERWR